jgi:hypothetical protein
MQNSSRVHLGVKSSPIQSEKITGLRILKISPSITVTFADDPQTRRLVYTITFLTCAKRTSRSTKHLEPASTSYNYQPNRKLITKNRGDACASKPPMHTTANNLCHFPIIICHLGMLFDDPPLKGRKRRKTNRMTQPQHK